MTDPNPIYWPRADKEALAKFAPETKPCTHNCGPVSGDPRSKIECRYLCDLCGPAGEEQTQ